VPGPASPLKRRVSRLPSMAERDCCCLYTCRSCTACATQIMVLAAAFYSKLRLSVATVLQCAPGVSRLLSNVPCCHLETRRVS